MESGAREGLSSDERVELRRLRAENQTLKMERLSSRASTTAAARAKLGLP